ncbi:MAG: DUF58 domain-containing protein [Solobacterium sp.]|nr:DUF58 domain-containing protein [Solobacterium sp.]
MTVFSFILLIIIGLILQQTILKHGLDDVSYDIRSDSRCVECDTPFKLITSVANNKLLPVFFLRLSELVPLQLNIAENEQNITRRIIGGTTSHAGAAIEQVLYVMPRQRVTRELEVSLPKRGRYLLRGATLTGGDLLGITENSTRVNMAREIIVYPRRADIKPVEHAFGGYLGEVSVRRFIMPDPMEIVGFREYTGREPQRDISWKETLRRNRLMVKQYDFTAEQRASLILDISDAEEEQIEHGYEITRSICEYLESRRIRYSFYTNARMTAVNGSWTYIPDGIGSVHLNTILEGLGRAELDTFCSFRRLLHNTAQGRDDGRSYILVTANPARKQQIIARYERQLGQKIFIIDIDHAGGKGR